MQEEKIDEEYVVLEDVGEVRKDDLVAKIEGFLESRLFVATIFVLVSLIAFFLGRVSVSKVEKVPVRVTNSGMAASLGGEAINTRVNLQTNEPDDATPAGSTSEIVVGSKNGNKYHYPWCPGAKQISDKNLIKFNSIAEAQAKGYTPASNCKGLK